jgi:hypothetical protein
VLAGPKLSVLKSIKYLLEDGGRVDLTSSNAFLRSSQLTPQEMRLVMLIRANRLHTKCRDARWAQGTARRIAHCASGLQMMLSMPWGMIASMRRPKADHQSA